MLDILRKKKEHWVSAFIVLAVAVVMGFFGVSKFSDDKANPNQPVAWVNGDIISQRDFSSELEFTLNQYRMVLGDKFDEKLFAYQLPQQTLERMIQFKLLCQQAEKMGFLISDQELADQIRTNPYFQKDGKFDASLYSKIPNRGMMERRQREQMAAGRLQTYMTNRIKALPADTEASQLLKDTQVELQVAAINFDQLAPKQAPTAETLKGILGNETLLKNQYEARKLEYTDPGKFEFRQIRIGVPFESGAEVRKKAEDKIQTLRKSLSPNNFQEVAKAQSDDEFAKKGGDRGWVQESSLDPTLIQALSSLKPGEVSPVFQGPGGFFIVQLKDRVPSQVRPLETVKNQLAEQIAKDQSKTQFVATTRKKWEDLLAQGKPLDSELKAYGISLKKTGTFSLDKNSIPDIGSVESMLEGVYDLTPTQPIPKRLYFYQDKYYYLKLVSISKAAPSKPEANSTKEKNEAVVFQRDVFQTWLASIEKQASIKFSGPFEKKNKG
ncbi:MAG: SurA N-terminal domain-containing protein [Pseudomonadota bacterium]